MKYQEQVIVTRKEGARYLGIGLTKFNQLIQDGEVRSFTIGSRRLVTLTALNDYVAERGARV